MSQLAMDFPPRRLPPPPRYEPSDLELWQAVFHVDGYTRARELLERRHGGDVGAMLRDLEAFRPPTHFRCQGPEPGWAGSIVVLKHELAERFAREHGGSES